MLKEILSIKNVLCLLTVVPTVLMIAGCTQQISLTGEERSLAQRKLTEDNNVIIYPDDRPSITDGKAVWLKMNCAQCHGENGRPVAGTKINLSDPKYMAKQKPVEQYQFLAYGKADSKHPRLINKLNNREIWDLVFYTRSLGITPISHAEWEQIDPVFGSNCAVCHGKKGFGDGPLAHNMEPVPANFHQFNRFFDRDDDTLFDHIANGINDSKGKPTFSGMPNFKGKVDKAKNIKFDDPYMHKLVQYVRQFHSSVDPTLIQPESTK